MNYLKKQLDIRQIKLIMMILILTFNNCSSHRVILGEIEIYGNNEIKIDAPVKR